MLGISSLIWTICHKLMWFYRNDILFHIIFVVTHGEIYSHLGHTGPLTVTKMALPLMYRRRWRHIHAFIGRNTIALRVLRFAAGANVICLTYARLMSCHWSCDPRRVKISDHSEQLQPCGPTSHFVNNRHSRIKTQGASCIGRFWPNWWSEKIWAGNSQKSACVLY